MAAVAIGVVILIGCFAQATTGTGLGLISGGIVVALLGRESGIMLLTVVSVPMMTAVAWQNRREIQWVPGLLIGITATALTAPLALTLRGMNQSVLLVIAGILVIVSVTLLFVGLRAPGLATVPGAALTGSLVSLLNMLSGTGGPPAAIYAVNAKWGPHATRGTLQIIFFGVSAATILSLEPPSWSVGVVAAAASAALVGTVSGMAVAKRIPADLARRAVLGLAGIGGVIVLGSGIGQLAG